MTDLRSALEKYLSMRKGLGYKYEQQTRRLGDFVAFMEKRKATTITTKLAMEWATLPPDRHASWALRLTDVRGFARHVSNLDPGTEVPPVGVLPGWKRAKPHIYSDAQIDALLAAALALPPKNGLRRWTYHTLFGLIAVTGMRLSEVMGLKRDDVDLDTGVLTVAGVAYEVDAELAGETVVVWWGLFDQELWVERDEERFGPYHPVGGPIPLHRYRKHRKSRREVRADRVGDLAQLLVLPRAALSGEADVVVVGAGPTVSADQVPVRPFCDPARSQTRDRRRDQAADRQAIRG
jgi:hypothetical protein